MSYKKAIVWFYQELRIENNAALHAAWHTAEDIYPVFCFDCDMYGQAQYWWLKESLDVLRQSLKSLGLVLHQVEGKASIILPYLCQRFSIDAVYWNQKYITHDSAEASALKQALQSSCSQGVPLDTHAVMDPSCIISAQGSIYKTFQGFRRHFMHQYYSRVNTIIRPLEGEKSNSSLEGIKNYSIPIMPWAKKFSCHWQPGEQAAKQVYQSFMNQAQYYADHRNYPAVKGTSLLSPYMHFGEIDEHDILNNQRLPRAFIDEVIWRCFFEYLMFHFPTMKHESFQNNFKNFPWENSAILWERWKKGETGYSIVDAGMKQLWAMGWMHNRVRMVVASFLTKHLLIDWRWGAQWFWDTLLDANSASNIGNWQWVAGCGPCAAPYFRIFNPDLQAQRYDQQGNYINMWVKQKGCLPVINHATARQRALEKWSKIKRGKIDISL